MAEMGGFGMSVPEEYGGFATGGEADYMGMVVATEELSWGSLGAGGSLITRPEILTRALVHGGTEEQKQRWLPRAGHAPRSWARWRSPSPTSGPTWPVWSPRPCPTEGGWLINGVKTWCTFAARADVLMLLARTDPDRAKAHRGLSLFLVEKPRGEGHGFLFTQEPGTDGRPAGIVGADGGPGHRHPRLPGHALLRGGLRELVRPRRQSGRRARRDWARVSTCRCKGSRTAGCRRRPGPSGSCRPPTRPHSSTPATGWCSAQPIIDYQLTRAKLARMAVLIQATRQFSYEVARLMSKGEGTLEASMIKAYVCRAAEWVTREALQIHGGMGYAEEFRSAGTSWTPGCCPSSRVPTRHWPSRSSPAGWWPTPGPDPRRGLRPAPVGPGRGGGDGLPWVRGVLLAHRSGPDRERHARPSRSKEGELDDLVPTCEGWEVSRPGRPRR